MEENKKEIEETVNVSQTALQEGVPTAETNTENVVATNPVPEVNTSDFSSAPVITEVPTETSNQEVVYTATGEVGTPLKKTIASKKKANKTLIIVGIFVLIFGGVMLLLSGGGSTGGVDTDTDEEQKEIEVEVGSEWGNAYLTYMLKNHAEIKEYEISFMDIKEDNTPEMLVKYTGTDERTYLKILYIYDEDVYETKAFKNFRIRYIYSLKEKTLDWYIYLSQSEKYGNYTKLSKIVDEMAFDSDIKCTSEKMLIQYGKQYYDTDYQPTFYKITEFDYLKDYKNFIKKYDGYVAKIMDVKNKVSDKYKDYVYKEEGSVVKDYINVAGANYKYGNYYAFIPANEEEEIMEHIAAITLNKDGTVIIRGELVTCTIDEGGSALNCGMYVIGLKQSNTLVYMGNTYRFEKYDKGTS